MKKIRRITLFIRKKLLLLWRFIDNEKYREVSYHYFKDCGVNFIGKPKYINYDVDFDLTELNLITIGNNTVIAKESILLTHDYSIECGLKSIGKTDSDFEMQFLKKIEIGSDCFIGARTFVLPGTTIGNNCIIGAGSVVSGNIPDNSIYVGNPAKFVAKTTEWAERKYNEKTFVYGTEKVLI